MALPLDPFYEAARRQLEDQLQAALAQIAAARPELMGQNRLQMARLGTNEAIDTRNLNYSLAGRGLFNSGVRTEQTGQLGMGYDRQRQDAAFSLAQALGGLSEQAAQARGTYTQGLSEAQLDLARRMGQDPYAALPKYGRVPHRPKRVPIPGAPNRRR